MLRNQKTTGVNNFNKKNLSANSIKLNLIEDI